MAETTEKPTPLRRLWRDESGTMSFEFALWLPFYVALLGLTVDVSMLFLTQAGLWNAAHDTSRQLSMGEMTEAEGESYGTTKASYWSDNAVVDATLLTDRVEVEITVPASDIAVFGFLDAVGDFDIAARTIHLMEPGAGS